MGEYDTGIARIREILRTNPDGLSISEIADNLQMNRNSVAKYLDILLLQGAVDGRKRGTSKLFYLSQRLPVTSLSRVCSDPYLVIDQDQTITELNPSFSRLVKIPVDRLVQHSYDHLPFRLTENASPDQILKSAFRGLEQRARALISVDGRSYNVTLRFLPVVFETGRPGISVIVDESDLSAENPPERAGSSIVPAFLDDHMEFIVRQSPEGIIRYVNETYCRAAGKSREDLVGRLFKPLVSAEDADRIRMHLSRLSPRFPVGIIEYKAVMANGEIRHQRWNDRALFNERGEPDGFYSLGMDITDLVSLREKLKKTQDTLEDSIVSRTEELRTVNRQLYDEIAQREKAESQLLHTQFAMDHGAEMVFWVNNNARVQYANLLATQATGYTGSEILNLQVTDIFPHYTLGEWDQMWGDLKKGSSLTHETSMVKKDGSRFPAEVAIRYLEYHGAGLAYCFCHDISDRTRMAKALQQANHKINLYTSLTRHDVQNKITVILGYLTRTKKLVSDPTVLEYLERQERAVKSIRNEIQLTHEFKDLGVNPPQWISLPDIIRTAQENHADKQVPVVSTADDVEIFADGHLVSVFDHLFENAVQHGKKTTVIRIRSEFRDHSFVIFVEDDGTGVKKDDKETIFTLQLENTPRSGLFIAREILSLTGITIRETGEYGSGARFEIVVPYNYYRHTHQE